jgi:2-oxoglutarate ferredoxin oxidoreductase subunit alpha
MSEVKERLAKVVIRFAGDSGDGMQLTGTQFSDTSAFAGNDLSTFNDYPAEIRAPAGTLYGVSGFQLCFGDDQVFTPGDSVDVLVAMNPASLKVSLPGVKEGGILIINQDAFTEKNLKLAGYENNPLENGALEAYRVIPVALSSLTREALKDFSLGAKLASRSKNMFALGMMYWMYTRPLEPTVAFIEKKFASKKEIAQANILLLKTGYNYADSIDLFADSFQVAPANLESGTYRNVNGAQATVYGLVAATVKSGLNLFLGSYPITPASDLLHELSHLKKYSVATFQAEDEIAAIAAAIGASYGGSLGVTTTSGPGFALKMEALGLAVMAELPLVVINSQRGGPSTGLPTKTEQSDLLQAMYGRNGESPVIVLSASCPSDSFEVAYEACRLAVKYRHPVVMMTEGYIVNGTEPWKIPEASTLDAFDPQFAEATKEGEVFYPYLRHRETLARPWAIPGVVGNEHRIGGLEKEDGTGNVSYDPDNHQKMVSLRAEKISRVQTDIPNQEIHGSPDGEVLVLGWGGTFGAIHQAVIELLADGKSVAHAHLRYLNPFPENLETILWKYKHVLVPELNEGQLSVLLRSRFLVPVKSYNKVKGTPFSIEEIKEEILQLMEISE